MAISASDLLHDAGLFHRTYPSWPHAEREREPEPTPAPRIVACVTSAGIPGHARTSDGEWGFDPSEEFPGWREAFWRPGPRAVFAGFAPPGLAACAAWVASGQAAAVLAEVRAGSEGESRS